MSGAAGIRAGGAYVEIFARDGAFNQAMNRVQSKLRAVAQTMQRAGTGMSLAGLGLGMPLVQAARQAASFEDALLGMRAAAGLTETQVKKMADEAKRLSADMGAAPEAIATAFMELAKAGMSVEEVLAGAGKSAVEFSRVSGVDAERAAVFMKTAMNLFGVSAQEAADTLSAAADSSETSIANMIESFSQVGSVGKTFGQSLFGISQAMAALAKSNIMGEEAGTAIKTMLTRLVAPTQDAQEALARLGLTMFDFRDQAGNLLPLQQIVGVFEKVQQRMGNDAFSKILSDAALVDVFEQRGIKVISALTNIGQKGLAEIGKQMQGSTPVAEKFKIVMSGISGQFERLSSGVKRVSIAFGEAISGPLAKTTDVLLQIMEALARLIEVAPGVAVAAAAIAAGLVAVGTAAILASIGLKGLAVIVSPGGIIAAAVVMLGTYVAKQQGWLDDLEETGMRVQAIWKKVGIYIAAAFDAEVSSQIDTLLKQVDDDLAQWKKKHQADKQRQQTENALRPDAFRKPLEGKPPVAAGDGKRNVVSAGTFGSAVGLGIGPQLADPMKQVEQNTKKTAEGIEKIVQHFKDNPRQPQGQVIDTTKGEKNDTPPMAKDLASLPWWAPAEEARKLGAFQGDGTAAEAGRRINEAFSAAIKQSDLGDTAAMSPSRAAFLNNPNMLASRGVAAASATTSLSLPRQEVKTGFDSVVDACSDTTAAIKDNNKLLDRMMNKLDGLRVSYQ